MIEQLEISANDIATIEPLVKTEAFGHFSKDNDDYVIDFDKEEDDEWS